MKKLIVFLATILLAGNSIAQMDYPLFEEADESIKSSLELGLVDEYTLLELDEATWENILADHPDFLTLTIPYGEEELTLSLSRTHLFANDLQIRTASGESLKWSEHSRSVFYQGTFSGYSNSHFALSVLGHKVIGIGSIPGIGDVNLGKTQSSEYYTFCSEAAIDGANHFSCETRGEPTRPEGLGSGSGSRELVEDCSSIYFEVDFDIFEAEGGVIEAADFINALFNEIQFLYELDDMTIYISDMLVWDEESPYTGIVETGTVLDLFGTTTTDWEGDLGHLVSLAMSGGLAWVDVFCSPDQALRKAVSGINLSFAEVPIYSWSVEVIAHEMGHNMGSPHTHACFWNDDMTAIDGCGPSAGFDEGCEGDLPDEGGTVMSYCHLTDVGINLGFGFGPQPGELMRTNILESECLTSCDLQVMDIHVNGGSISPACDNEPIFTRLSVTNNSNENFTFCDLEVYLNGDYYNTYVWSGNINEEAEGTVNLPEITLPLGVYSMRIVIVMPDGYEDETPGDNDFTIDFEVTPKPIVAFTPSPDQLVSLDATSVMQNETTGGAVYEWDFDDGSEMVTGFSPEHTFPFESGGVYNVRLRAYSPEGCMDETTRVVSVTGVNVYYIPNSFTESQNEFGPVFSAGLDVYDYHFIIFNRYGEILFESYDVTTGWNGRYGSDGDFVPSGTYVWKLEFGDTHSDERHIETGHVNFIR